MSDPVNKITDHVAETLWQQDSIRAVGRRRLIEWADAGEAEQEKWRDLARAALRAMEFATDSMAGYAQHRNPGVSRELAKGIWFSMMDQAINGR